MGKQRVFIFVFGSVLILGVIGALSYKIYQNTKTNNNNDQLQLGNFSPGNTADTYYEKKKTEQTSTGLNDTGSLQVLGEQEAQEKTPQSETGLPGPNNFKQYEKYINNDSALYAVIKAGTGEAVKANDVAAIVYTGYLTDGTVFDESPLTEDGKIQAFNFTVGSGQVIAGLDQGIIGMKVGGKRRLIIPPKAGYGEAGQRSIPPNSMLIFDIELAAVNP